MSYAIIEHKRLKPATNESDLPKSPCDSFEMSRDAIHVGKPKMICCFPRQYAAQQDAIYLSIFDRVPREQEPERNPGQEVREL